MSSLYLILALVFGLVIALVAIANTEPVNVNYIFGRSDVSLIILILGSAFAGAMVMGMINLFRGIKAAFSFRQVRLDKEALQKKVDQLEEEKIFLQAEVNKMLSGNEDQHDLSSKLDFNDAKEELHDKPDDEGMDEEPS